ncbi:uncharacterized protein LOC131056845 isoform X1 [Cryptomeria japonica]|uniref:uncharacterized protein LOC131056845 isoform X1 n=1 Tax=Cryptomeria japonica TaxID=3369 RepID=UPI0027DA0C44|nr:uncharacterized protein LOC131056845 isoform X1 [Cryptomeria japonica]
MGKLTSDGVARGENTEEQNSGCCNASRVCNRSNLKIIVAVVISVNLLLVGIYNLPMFRKHNGENTGENLQAAQVQASFMLKRPLSIVNANILELESDIWEEIFVPNAKVKIISLRPLAEYNGTDVAFGIVPNQENSSISSADLSVLRETFTSLVLETYNLSLTHSVFGRAYFFQVLSFPKGITVIPEQAHFPLLHMQVLFNFTLNYSIFQVVQNLAQLKQELEFGLRVKPTENLFVQLTNLEGSTVEPSTIIETSIMPVVGNGLAKPRLKQLAQEITGDHAGNLGLNHTLFGKVKQIMLSSYLRDPTSSPSPVPSPSPSPSHSACSSPVPTPQSSASPVPSVHHHHHHHATAPSSYHCHHHHCKCGHKHHARSGVTGSPSPSPSHAKTSRKKPCIHHHVGVAPVPAIALPPQSIPPSQARPCHGHLPSFPLVSPSTAPSHLDRVPPISTPKPSVIAAVSPSKAPPPASKQAHAELTSGNAPVPALSSSAFNFVPPIQLIISSVLLVETFLIYFLP